MPRKLIPLTGGVVCAGIGLLAGFLLWKSPPAQHQPLSAPTHESERDRPSPKPSPKPQQPAAVAAPAEDVDPVARAIEQIGASRLVAPAGGTIAGTVKLPDGRPLPGIRIEVKPALPWYGGGTWVDPDEYLRRQVARIQYIQSGRAWAVTSDDGAFRVAGLGDFAYVVKPVSERYHFEPGAMDRVRSGASLRFTATPRVRVTVDVTAPDGSAATAAVITGSGPEWLGGGVNWTPGSPDLWLAPGEWQLRAWQEKGGPVRSEPTRVYVPHELASLAVSLKLIAVNGIAGRFLIPHSLYDGRFELRHAPEDDLSPLMPDERGFLPDGLSVNADGRFEILELEPGTWVVVLYEHGGRELARASVRVTQGVAEVAIPVSEPNLDDYIPLRVLGPDGNILRDASVRHRVVSTIGPGGNGGTQLRRPDGSLWLGKHRGSRGGDVLRWEISATHDRLGTLTADYNAKDTHELVMRFEPAATLIVEIPNAAAHPRREYLGLYLQEPAEAFAWWEMNAIPYDYQSRRDEPLPGRMVFGPVQPGPRVLRMTYGRFRRPTILIRDVELKPGEQSLRVEAPQVHDLTMTIPQVEGVDHAILHIFGLSVESTASDEQHRVTWQGLPAGTYRVTIPHTPGAMLVRVPAGGPVAYEAREPNAWEISRLDANGIAQKAGLAHADLVVSINGESGRGEQQLEEILGRAAESPQLVLEVRRAGQALTVTLSPEEFHAARGAQMMIRPALVGD